MSSSTNSNTGLETDKYHEMAKKYLRRGFGGVLSFGVRGGTAGSKYFVDALKLVSNMTKLVTSLISLLL